MHYSNFLIHWQCTIILLEKWLAKLGMFGAWRRILFMKGLLEILEYLIIISLFVGVSGLILTNVILMY